MAAQLIDGKAVADQIVERVRRGVVRFRKKHGRAPGLTVILVGDDPASAVYVRSKAERSETIGMRSKVHRLPKSASEKAVLDLVRRENRNPYTDGILVQLPLPLKVNETRVLSEIRPDKDVDGLHAMNAGELFLGRPSLVPCTPAGVIEALAYYKIPIEGARAVVIGRSDIVGKPMSMLLLHRHATVTICHSRTRNIARVAREADILVAAIGRPGFVTPDFVRKGATVIDVGINYMTDEAWISERYGADSPKLRALRRRGGVLVGDVDFTAVSRKAGAITPVPGGVGPLTIAMLLSNTLDAATRRLKRR